MGIKGVRTTPQEQQTRPLGQNKKLSENKQTDGQDVSGSLTAPSPAAANAYSVDNRYMPTIKLKKKNNHL